MGRRLMNSVSAFVRRDEGLTTAEYAILVGLVVVVVMGSVALIGGMSSTFDTTGAAAAVGP